MFIAVNASMIGKINEILDTVKMTPAQIKGSNDTKINDSSYPSLQKINNTPNVSTKNLVNALGNKGGFASSFSSGLSMNLRNQENPNGVVGAAPIHNQIATNLRRNSTENLLSEIKSYCLKSFMGTQASKDVSSTTGPDISLKNGDADQLTSSLKGSTINQLASLLQSTIGIHSNNKISNIQNEQPSTPKGSANNTLLVSNVVKTLSPGQSVSLLSERLKKEVRSTLIIF